jgi:hypothetical protein
LAGISKQVKASRKGFTVAARKWSPPRYIVRLIVPWFRNNVKEIGMMSHCILHRPNRPFHITDSDFALTSENAAQTAAKRVLEWKTDMLIEDFAELHPLPPDHLPPDDYLWISEWEVAPAQLAFLTVETRGKTTFSTTMAELIARHEVAERYVAYRGSAPRPAHAHIPLSYDLQGRPFLVVSNYAGDYQDGEGVCRNAFKDGYSRIFKQYRYCIDVVNAAIAKLEGRAAVVVQRWAPSDNEAVASTSHRKRVDATVQKNTASTSVALGGYLSSTKEDMIFTGENTTPTGNESMSVGAEPDQWSSIEALRTAPRTPETWLGLLSTILPVPEQAKTDPEVWDREWWHPVGRLLAATSTLSDMLAWERTGITASYMTDESSPSWWVQGRQHRSPVTARHVADNYLSQWRDCQAKQWRPAHLVPYVGPPLTEYEQGYTGITQAIEEPALPVEEVPEPPIIIEEPELPAHPVSMSQEKATDLFNEIWDQYQAQIHAAITPYDATRDRWYTSIELGAGQGDWYHFATPEDWRLPSPEAIDAIEAALRYTALQGAAPDPGGDIVPDGPPETDALPEDAYVSMAELTAEMQRGLRPALPPPITEELTPPIVASGTVGMRLHIADALLKSILLAGYHAERHQTDAEHAVVCVETSPGVWETFERMMAWQRWQTAARASPGSIGAVIASAAQGQQVQAAQ